MNLSAMIRAVQAAYGLDQDGVAGPKTWTAIYRDKVGKEPPGDGEPDSSPIDARSEKLVHTLHPAVQPYARALVHAAADRGITLIVTSATRTYAEQDALFAKRPPVTKARGGYSNHNFGIAFDVTIFKRGRPVWESPSYKAVGAIGIGLGLEWGGSWHSFEDEPHFQLRPRWAKGMPEADMLAELRRRKRIGKDAFA